MRRGYKSLTAIIFSVAAVSACAPAPKPVVIAPPPPVIVPPPRPPVMPLPPGGAAASMRIPSIGIDGVRVTPNRGLSRDNAIWHFRAALNVAALNCQGPVWGQIAPAYNKFIVTHKVQLSKSSKAVDREYVAKYPGQNGLRVRDTASTDLYNYFALPPVRAEYCDTALRKVNEANLIPLATFPEYAISGLTDIDGIFVRFFDAYAQYERDLADWNMKHAPRPVYAPSPTQSTTAPSAATPTAVPASNAKKPG
jgi:hypothetical protein